MRVQKRKSEPLVWKLPSVCVLGTKLGLSSRAVHTINLQPHKLVLKQLVSLTDYDCDG